MKITRFLLTTAISAALCSGTCAFLLAESAHAGETYASTGVYVTFDDSSDGDSSDGDSEPGAVPSGGKGVYIAPSVEEKPSDDGDGDSPESPGDPKEEGRQSDKTRDKGEGAERETPPRPSGDSGEDPLGDEHEVEVPVTQEIPQVVDEQGVDERPHPGLPPVPSGGWMAGNWLRGGQRSSDETGAEPVATALGSLPVGELLDRELKRVAHVVDESFGQDVEAPDSNVLGGFFARAGAVVAEMLAAVWGWVMQFAIPLAALAAFLAAALLLAHRVLPLPLRKRDEKIIVLERDGSEEEFSWNRLKASIEEACSASQGVTPLEIVEIANEIESELKDMPKEDRTAQEIASLVKSRLSGVDEASGASYSERHGWLIGQAGV